MNNRWLLLCFSLMVLVAPSCAILSGWTYFQDATINNTGSNLTNYQMNFTVNTSSGTSSGTTIYLNSHAQSDLDDLRFTSTTDTVYDYWIETATNTSTQYTVWVEIPSIVNSTAYGNTTVRVQYGNAGASAYSNGESTFPRFFDDFPGTTLNTSKWTFTGGGSNSISNSVLTGTGGTNYKLRTVSTSLMDTSGVLEVYMKASHMGDDNTHYGVIDLYDGTRISSIDYANPWMSRSTAQVALYITGWWNSAINGWATNTWLKAKFVRTGSAWKWYINNANEVTGVGYWSNNGAYYAFHCDIVAGGATPTYNTDWVFVREWAATEPAVPAWASELSVPTAAFSANVTSGENPLTVGFTDASTGTPTAWYWNIGGNISTSQNPVYTFTIPGLYSVSLNASNSYGYDWENKTDYINVTPNMDYPVADFAASPLCANTSETIYFIDFSTGAYIWDWNWSFGDGAYSTLKNPTHSYSSSGTYDISLTINTANGTDTETKLDYITIPCAPGVTPTPTGTYAFNQSNITVIDSGEQAYLPWEIYAFLVVITFALFISSLLSWKSAGVMSIAATVMFPVIAYLTAFIDFHGVKIEIVNSSEVYIIPYNHVFHPPYLAWLFMGFFFASILNVYFVWTRGFKAPEELNEEFEPSGSYKKTTKLGKRR